MKWTILILAACWACGPAAAAETAQDRGKRVVNEALAALGGDAFLHMEDRVESGRAYSFYRGELAGSLGRQNLTRYLVAPDPPAPARIPARTRGVRQG